MIRIEVKVKPCARESTLIQQDDGTWSARLKSAPVDGKANKELVQLVATEFGVRKNEVTIRAGAGARIKRIQIER
tara:strand:- start:109 stop:333 length:225 start_codon:yes stop_codon:yes gene_type:complete